MLKVFLDSDIILDFLTGRQPFHIPAKEIFELSSTNKMSLYTSPIIISNVNYIVGSLMTEATAFKKTRKLLKLIQVVPVNQKVANEAAQSKFKDFEDALQNYAAQEAGIKIIITRNVKDYKESELSILTPLELLTRLDE